MLLFSALLCLAGCRNDHKAPATGNYVKDLALFKNILEATHAGLYNYHTKKEIDSIFNYYSAVAGNQQLSIPEFYRYLSIIITYIGSLHDNIYMPRSAKDSLQKQKAFFPYPLKFIDDKLVMNFDSAAIPLGSQILSVNGHKADSFLVTLGHYYTTDGYNVTGKKVGVEQLFSWYYCLEYGMPETFTVNYIPYGATAAKEITLEPVTLSDQKKRAARRHSLYLDTLLEDRYLFTWATPNTAVLAVNTFGLGNAQSATHKAYRKFLDSVFSLLKTRPTANLIVDIRKNGGGNDPNDLLTFSYLAYGPFKENDSAYTLFQQLPFKAYYIEEDSGDLADLESNFLEEHNRLIDGKYYQNPNFNKPWQPNPLAFRGKVYLLVGPQVASAASLFASLVRSEGKVTVAGEETMGGYYGHTGHNSVMYRLPDSHIAFELSLVNIKQYVRSLQNIPYGKGVLPDIAVQQNMDGFINNRDHVLDTALRLIEDRSVTVK